jgi:ribosome biogenesis GTPase / thiamine phosphate phosphatase
MNSSLPDTFEADVVATFGRHLIVRDATAREIPARPSGRKLGIVCGDRVRCELDRTHDEVLAVEVLPRRTMLARANLRGGSEAVVANLSQLVVVLAPLPAPDFFVVDRYLCAATSAGLEAVVAVNKIDIDGEGTQQELAAYGAAGYTLLRCSAKQGAGLAELRQGLVGHRSALVGQSGVGKSSLVNALLPQLGIATGELASDDEGRHTTTASRSYTLESGGMLIDSPGVRDFAPAIEQLDERTMGFPEVARLAAECRFQDCKHLQEPNCAVSTAASDGSLAPRRYESYRRLRRLYADLVTARGPAYRRRPG